MAAIFGPAGSSDSFKTAYKSTLDMPVYLEARGLGAFEYQCGRGVRIKEEAARALGESAKIHGVQLSVHAPYYISLSSVEEEKRLKNSANYILQSAQAVSWMGGDRIVVHAGSCSKMSREEALALAKDSLQYAINTVDEAGLGHVHICPETMGKINQLGNLEEVMEMCSLDDRLLPCLDFGHLNARTFGALKTKDDYKQIFNTVENRLGRDRMRMMHVHFSKIEYTEKGGEKVHLTFEDTTFGPDFQPLMELFSERDCSPVVICESAGTQAEDALTMQQYYQQVLAGK